MFDGGGRDGGPPGDEFVRRPPRATFCRPRALRQVTRRGTVDEDREQIFEPLTFMFDRDDSEDRDSAEG